ncbi:hypothetical protein ABZX88_34450 [Kitasatospora aureofaciens]|uniref:hypothetical protein n=1 Tax=Kitasatospora aureofaciens TaxID=1894 RepID=UPI0033A8C332
MTTGIPATWRVSKDGLVPVKDVAASLRAEYGVGYDSVSSAVRAGLVPVAKVGGRGGARHVRVEDALFVRAVAALAAPAGLTFGRMLRTLRESGAQVTAAGLMIPIPQAA